MFFCSVRGFNNAFVFKSIRGEDVEKMQEYVRTKLKDLLRSNLKDEEFAEISYNLFGAFSNRPNEFEFNAGEERLIEQMAKYVKIKIDNQQEGSNLAHFQNMEHLNVKKIRYWTNELIETPLGLIYGRERVIENGKRKKIELRKSKDFDSLKENLFQATFRTLNKHIIQNEHFEEESKKLRENCVVVRIDETMAVKGEIICPFCDEKGEARVVKPYFQFLNGNGYWIMSNYGTHLKKYHTSTMQIESVTLNEDSSISLINQDHNYSTISFKIEPAVPSPSGLDDQSQQFEDELYRQMTFQNLKIMNTVLSNKENIKSFSVGSTSRNTSVFQIKICEIAADNSCMYGAIAHQLFFVELGSLEHAKWKKELRQSTVKYINENFSNFTGILKDRVYEIKKKNLITDMDEECRNFVNTHSVNPDCWGGTESLKAISELHKVNIVVINHDGTCNSTQQISSEYSRTITILFRHPTSSCSQSVSATKSIIEADLKKRKFLKDIKDCEVSVID